MARDKNLFDNKSFWLKNLNQKIMTFEMSVETKFSYTKRIYY